jgi:hypothetical protein
MFIKNISVGKIAVLTAAFPRRFENCRAFLPEAIYVAISQMFH